MGIPLSYSCCSHSPLILGTGRATATDTATDILSTMGARMMMSFGIYSLVILLLSGVNPIAAQDCDMDCYVEELGLHVSFGTPVGGVMTLCECRDLCHDDDACIAFDFNTEATPYQDHSCWLHYVAGDLIHPSMEVNHY